MAKRQPKSVRILGKRWLLVHSRLRDDHGRCDDPANAGKTITISTRMRDRDLLETYIHEFLHAAEWHKDEHSWVTPVARDIARELWRLGYRRSE